MFDRQRQKRSSEKAVLQTCFLHYARGGLSLDRARRMARWRVGNHVMAKWADDDEYYEQIR